MTPFPPPCVSLHRHGRGCYISEDKGFIIWVGEEDHLRIMCMRSGSVLNHVFDRLKVDRHAPQVSSTLSVCPAGC